MSLLELIARRSRTNAAAFSLPELLAERALAQVSGSASPQVSELISGHFAAKLLENRPAEALRYAELLIDHGIPERRLMSAYVAGAAEQLGRAWEDDTLSFAQVTNAMGLLMQVVRELTAEPPPASRAGRNGPRVLMARAPGEEHVLGLILAAREMRRRGWLVRLDLSGEEAAISAACSAHEFDVIGFTAAGAGRIADLQRSVGTARRCAQDARIVTGGWLGADDPGAMAEKLGVDLVLGRNTAPVDMLERSFRLERV